MKPFDLKATLGPYKLADSGRDLYITQAKLQGREPEPHEGYFRENSGDWIIGNGDVRVGTATFKGRAKRGEGYNAPDPEGMANAKLFAASWDMANSLKEVLALQQAVIDVGGTKGPLDQELIEKFAEMQNGVDERIRAALLKAGL